MTRDALRPPEGMAYKNALADLPLGGGKAVIAEPATPYDRRALFEAFGRAVARLRGDYITAEDVRTTVADMERVRDQTSNVTGLPSSGGRPGGDPSPWTALGVFVSMQEAVRRKFGSDLAGITVAVQGLGNVGSALCALLRGVGAKLIVAEPRADMAAAIACRYGATAVSVSEIVEALCEVFAPCALGGALNGRSVPKLNAGVVCGGANNVLATSEDGERLAEPGILYAPDYVVNAGGIIDVAAEYLGWSCEEAETRVRGAGERLAGVLDFADQNGMPANRAADALARAKILTTEMRIPQRAA